MEPGACFGANGLIFKSSVVKFIFSQIIICVCVCYLISLDLMYDI